MDADDLPLVVDDHAAAVAWAGEGVGLDPDLHSPFADKPGHDALGVGQRDHLIHDAHPGEADRDDIVPKAQGVRVAQGQVGEIEIAGEGVTVQIGDNADNGQVKAGVTDHRLGVETGDGRFGGVFDDADAYQAILVVKLSRVRVADHVEIGQDEAIGGDKSARTGAHHLPILVEDGDKSSRGQGLVTGLLLDGQGTLARPQGKGSQQDSDN